MVMFLACCLLKLLLKHWQQRSMKERKTLRIRWKLLNWFHVAQSNRSILLFSLWNLIILTPFDCHSLEKANPQRWVRDGAMTELASATTKKGPQEYHYYLFSNCLVRAKQNRSKMRLKPYKFKESIPIDLLVVADIDDTPDAKVSNSFLFWSDFQII